MPGSGLCEGSVRIFLILFVSFKLVDSKAVIAAVSASSKLNINQARASAASASAAIVLMK